MAMEADDAKAGGPATKSVRVHAGLDEMIRDLQGQMGAKTRSEAEKKILDHLRRMEENHDGNIQVALERAKATAEGTRAIAEAIPPDRGPMSEMKSMIRDQVEVMTYGQMMDMLGGKSGGDSGKMNMQDIMVMGMMQDQQNASKLNSVMMMKMMDSEKSGENRSADSTWFTGIVQTMNDNQRASDERFNRLIEMMQVKDIEQIKARHEDQAGARDMQMMEYMKATNDAYTQLAQNMQYSMTQVPQNDVKSQVAVATEALSSLGSLTQEVRNMGLSLGLREGEIQQAVVKGEETTLDKVGKVLSKGKDLLAEIIPAVQDITRGGQQPPAPGQGGPPSPTELKQYLLEQGLAPGDYVVLNDAELFATMGQHLPPGDQFGVMLRENYNKVKGTSVPLPEIQLQSTEPPAPPTAPVNYDRVVDEMDDLRKNLGIGGNIEFRGGTGGPVTIPPDVETPAPQPAPEQAPVEPTEVLSVITPDLPPPEELLADAEKSLGEPPAPPQVVGPPPGTSTVIIPCEVCGYPAEDHINGVCPVGSPTNLPIQPQPQVEYPIEAVPGRPTAEQMKAMAEKALANPLPQLTPEQVEAVRQEDQRALEKMIVEKEKADVEEVSIADEVAKSILPLEEPLPEPEPETGTDEEDDEEPPGPVQMLTVKPGVDIGISTTLGTPDALTCPNCGQRFESVGHREVHQGPCMEASYEEAVEAGRVCQWCGKTLKSPTGRKLHENTCQHKPEE